MPIKITVKCVPADLSACCYKKVLSLYHASLISSPVLIPVLSPPMSPAHGSGDEAAHVRSILEGVCHTQDIGRDAVRKLCSHVQADPQEEQVQV